VRKAPEDHGKGKLKGLAFSAVLRGFDSIRGGVTTAVPQGVEQAMSIIGK
jgi:hypothetical protein